MVWEGRHREVPPYPDCPALRAVAHVLSAAGTGSLRTMRLHRVLDQLLTITMHRPYWSPTWRGARSDRALRSVPTYVGKLRSVALSHGVSLRQVVDFRLIG